MPGRLLRHGRARALRVGLTLATALLVVALAGCGDSGDGSSTSSTEATTDTATADTATATPTPTPEVTPSPPPTPDPSDEGAPTAAPATPTPTPAATTAATTPSPTPAPPTPTAEPLADRALPTTRAGLIAALTETEEALRDPAIDDVTATDWGRFQQRVYGVLADNPEWEADVLGGVSDTARFAVEQNLAARRALTSLVKSETLAETLPAWQLREPLPAAELIGYYREAEAQTGIPWQYLAAINLVETRMGRIEGVSTGGAVGPMQFLPSTWDECCQGDPRMDRDAIIGAATYLVQRGGLDDIRAALFGYNNSDRYVDGVSAYAEVIADNELAYRGYHAWQVYFLSAAGLILMPTDYFEPEPVAADEWLAEHPDALVAPPEEP